MLKKVSRQRQSGAGCRFVIVASRFNVPYVDAMVRAARLELKRAGGTVRTLRVPGAFEIPVVAAKLAASSEPPSAVICLGVIFQGQTSHAKHVAWGVTHALAQIQIQHHVPVIHGVFEFENKEHARVRCMDPDHSRGTEAARTAIHMAGLMSGI